MNIFKKWMKSYKRWTLRVQGRRQRWQNCRSWGGGTRNNSSVVSSHCRNFFCLNKKSVCSWQVFLCTCCKWMIFSSRLLILKTFFIECFQCLHVDNQCAYVFFFLLLFMLKTTLCMQFLLVYSVTPYLLWVLFFFIFFKKEKTFSIWIRNLDLKTDRFQIQTSKLWCWWCPINTVSWASVDSAVTADRWSFRSMSCLHVSQTESCSTGSQCFNFFLPPRQCLHV